VLAVAACRTLHGDPVPSARGTISGSLRAPGHERSTANREITIVDTATGRTFRTHTNDVGDYTVLVPPGTYRVNVVLRPREVLSTVPEPVAVGVGDVRADVNLIIAAAP
jgi:hypothetical protein